MINPDGDRAVLTAMRNAGADLTKPAHTLHYLYFPSQSSAESAAAELRAADYNPVSTSRAAAQSFFDRLFGKAKYVCVAETRAVPYEPTVLKTSRHMNELAAKYGGEYDGWEASIER